MNEQAQNFIEKILYSPRDKIIQSNFFSKKTDLSILFNPRLNIKKPFKVSNFKKENSFLFLNLKEILHHFKKTKNLLLSELKSCRTRDRTLEKTSLLFEQLVHGDGEVHDPSSEETIGMFNNLVLSSLTELSLEVLFSKRKAQEIQPPPEQKKKIEFEPEDINNMLYPQPLPERQVMISEKDFFSMKRSTQPYLKYYYTMTKNQEQRTLTICEKTGQFLFAETIENDESYISNVEDINDLIFSRRKGDKAHLSFLHKNGPNGEIRFTLYHLLLKFDYKQIGEYLLKVGAKKYMDALIHLINCKVLYDEPFSLLPTL